MLCCQKRAVCFFGFLERDERVVAAERYNDPFGFSGIGLDHSQWQRASNELWAPLTLASQEWCARCNSVTKQWLDFIQHRVAENWTLAEHLVACRTLGEVWSLYAEFLRKAAENYQKEFAFLGMAGSGLVTQKPKFELRRSTLQ